jgi:hypothetical protein
MVTKQPLAVELRQSLQEGLAFQDNLEKLTKVLGHFGLKSLRFELKMGRQPIMQATVPRDRLSPELIKASGEAGYGSTVTLRGNALSLWLDHISSFMDDLCHPYIFEAEAPKEDADESVSFKGDISQEPDLSHEIEKVPLNLRVSFEVARSDFINCPTVVGENGIVRYDAEEYFSRKKKFDLLLLEAHLAPLKDGTTPSQYLGAGGF